MFAPVCLVAGMEIENSREDLREAVRIEQYRVSKKAVYLPEGLKWKYLPLAAVTGVEESFRVISAGHCVPVREKRPEIDLSTEAGTIHLQLEKPESMRAMLAALGKPGT